MKDFSCLDVYIFIIGGYCIFFKCKLFMLKWRIFMIEVKYLKML